MIAIKDWNSDNIEIIEENPKSRVGIMLDEIKESPAKQEDSKTNCYNSKNSCKHLSQEDFPYDDKSSNTQQVEHYEELIQHLKFEIVNCKINKEMNKTSWDKYLGVLITGNQAKFLLKLLEEKYGKRN